MYFEQDLGKCLVNVYKNGTISNGYINLQSEFNSGIHTIIDMIPNTCTILIVGVDLRFVKRVAPRVGHDVIGTKYTSNLMMP